MSAAVPHSAGTNRPARAVPAGACDSHMHVFDPRFAPSPHWPRRPPRAEVAAYRQLQQRLGMQRCVVVTPSTYGTDNTCTLDALAQLGTAARGVAVVDAAVGDAALDRLAAQGVCGLRVNFVSPQSWGTTTPRMLEQLARKAARLGWHIQLLALPAQIVAMQALLADLPTPLVVDHLGRIDAAEGEGSAAFAVLRRLLDAGRTWLKLSGVYMASRAGAPAYADARALGQAFVQAAPERMLWGSDWPHTTEAPGSVNDADLLDVLHTWCGTDAVLEGILVANPARFYGFPGDS
ncbi:MAG TPA: amidohydrolase family protein [Pseudorhodoferax sp.]|nr:amidohydrolase family protein [Pseudorhodoferax sp.]